MKLNLENCSLTKYYFLLFVMYFIAHGGILILPEAIYWDDWTLFEVDPDIILLTFQEVGSMFNIAGYLHVFLLSIGAWSYKVLTFILMFSTGIAFDFILKKQKFIQIELRFLIVMFFLILPFYWARVALIDIVYTLSYFLFFFSWSILSKYRILAVLLFFISFNTNSLLVFYLLPFLDLYYRASSDKINVKTFSVFFVRNIDLALLPFIYFALKLIFYSPTGLYENYNMQFTLTHLFETPVRMLLDWSALKISVFPMILIFSFFYVLIRTQVTPFISSQIKTKRSLIIICVSSIIIACFPYWVLGHVPTFAEWTSRHQLLLPLGFSSIIALFLVSIKNEFRAIFCAALIAISLNLNIGTYKNLFFDWQKQKTIIQLLADEDLVRGADLVLFDDQAKDLNAINRKYRAYEWNGLLATAFGDEARFGFEKSVMTNFVEGSFFKGYFSDGSKYRIGDFSVNGPLNTVLVEIKKDKGRLRWLFDSFRNPLIKISVTQLSTTNLDPEASLMYQ